ncbi:hypothetical protein [Marinobacter sp.]
MSLADFEPCCLVFQKYPGESYPVAVFAAGLLNDGMKLDIEVTARVSA